MTFRPNFILRLYRYFFLLIFIGLPMYLASLVFDSSLVKQSDVTIHVSVCLILLICGVLLTHKFFWEKCFAKLIISNSEIIWKCLFRKTIIIPIDACNYIGVQQEESHNGLAYHYIYLSIEPYPIRYLGKINKISCKEGFIKFWYSNELANYLVSCMPGNKTGTLSAFRIQLKKK